MALSVIGAGLGRTGTMSLKLALEALGLGRCYHMTEVFPDPKAPALWSRAARGEPVDWEEIFAGYGATTDWPGCTFYRALADRYPEAKVILTVRDPDQWFDSTQATIFSDSTSAQIAGGEIETMMHDVVFGAFGGELHDRAHCIAAYERHNAEVRRAIPAARLLEYDAAEGWAPLCRFLGLPVPDMPFPSANSRAEFLEKRRPEAMKHLGR